MSKSLQNSLHDISNFTSNFVPNCITPNKAKILWHKLCKTLLILIPERKRILSLMSNLMMQLYKHLFGLHILVIIFDKIILQQMKRIVIIATVLLIGFMAFAQDGGAELKFEKVKHDFGKFKEEAGPQTANFVFTNTGSNDLLIQRVAASCGCTTPDWTKHPVKPGEKGFVKVTYDPRNRPNKFKKTAVVYTNATANGRPQVLVLSVEGDVVPKVKTTEDLFPRLYGNKMRFKSNHMAFTNVVKGKKKISVMEVINISKEDVKLDFERVPSHLSMIAKPAVLKPGEKGIIQGTYDSKTKNDWGYVNDLIRVSVNDSVIANMYLVVSANIVEDFSSLSKEELAAAAVITFEATKFDFGKMNQNEKVTVRYKYKNTGKSDLIIRKIRTTCGCTTVTKPNTSLKPGEESTLEAVFSSGVRKGKQHKMITVITNDPLHNQINLILTGEVLVPTK